MAAKKKATTKPAKAKGLHIEAIEEAPARDADEVRREEIMTRHRNFGF